METYENVRCPHGKYLDDYCEPCEIADQEESSRIQTAESFVYFAWYRLARQQRGLTADQHPQWPTRHQWEWRHRYGLDGRARNTSNDAPPQK